MAGLRAIRMPLPRAPAAGAAGGGRRGPGGGGGRWGGGSFAGTRSFVGSAAGMAIGLGLGSSLSGFFLQSGQKYMELSKVLTHVNRRFRETGESVGYMGARLGYTIGQTAQYVETLGSKTNAVSGSQVRRYLGFAREMGLDPGTAMSELGSLQRNVGSELTERQLMSLVGRARSMGMGQGRFGEFVQSTAQIAQMQLQAQGRASLTGAMTAQRLPGQVFGADDPRAQGSAGVDFMSRLNGVMTQGGPMQSYMMRVMGYGREDGPDYITMRKRLHEGVFNSANIIDLFGSFQEQGLGKAAQFRALESVSNGKLSPHDLERLVGALGTQEGLERYRKAAMSGEAEDALAYAASLTRDEQKTLMGGGGFEALARRGGRISKGEWRAVGLESMQMEAGEVVADVMEDMRGTIKSIAGMFQNLIGADIGSVITGISGNIEKLANFAERLSEPVGALGGAKAGLQHAGSSMGAAAAVSWHDPSQTRGSMMLGLNRMVMPAFQYMGVMRPGDENLMAEHLVKTGIIDQSSVDAMRIGSGETQ